MREDKTMWISGGPLDGLVIRTDPDTVSLRYWTGGTWHRYCTGRYGAELLYDRCDRDPGYEEDQDEQWVHIFDDQDECLGVFDKDQIADGYMRHWQ